MMEKKNISIHNVESYNIKKRTQDDKKEGQHFTFICYFRWCLV